MIDRLRETLGSRDAPLLWKVSAIAAVGGAGGLALGSLIGPPRLALGAAVAAIFVSAAGTVLPRGAGRAAAVVVAVGAVAFATLAAAVGGHAVAAGVAMAAVAFGSGVLAASGGTGMAIYEGTGNRDALWVMLTIFVVLQPNERASWDFAVVRTVGTFAGIIALHLLAIPLSHTQLLIAALIVLDLGLAWILRNPAVLTMATTVFAVAITEVLAPGFTDPAAHRLADTVVGAAIAIVVGYALFPDRGREEQKPGGAPA